MLLMLQWIVFYETKTQTERRRRNSKKDEAEKYRISGRAPKRDERMLLIILIFYFIINFFLTLVAPSTFLRRYFVFFYFSPSASEPFSFSARFFSNRMFSLFLIATAIFVYLVRTARIHRHTYLCFSSNESGRWREKLNWRVHLLQLTIRFSMPNKPKKRDKRTRNERENSPVDVGNSCEFLAFHNHNRH